MAEQLKVDPQSLWSAGAELGVEGQALAAALSRLQGRLGALGNVCGDDEQGQAFASGYQPKVAVIERALQSMVAGLAGIEKGLWTMARNYEGADSSSKVVGGPR
jgi:uncharacterized protein YukE